MTTNTLFLRLTNEPDKAMALAASLEDEAHPLRFKAEASSFALVPGSPFAYWVSDDVREKFKRFPPFEADGRVSKVGLQTSDDRRFLRCWWECDTKKLNSIWFPFAKGGFHCPYYSDLHLILKWGHEGNEIKEWAGSLYNKSHWSRIVKNVEYYFKPGLTWPIKNRFSFKPRAFPAGAIFAHVGPTAFFASVEDCFQSWALMSSACFTGLVRMMAGWNFEAGVIQRTPFPPIKAELGDRLAANAQKAWYLKQAMDQAEETSHTFLLPALINSPGTTLVERATGWNYNLGTKVVEVQNLQDEIDSICWDLYGIRESDRHALADPGAIVAEDEEPDETDGEEDSTPSASPGDLATDLASWLFGAALGRWDWGLATGDTVIPPLPGPFDPLPRVSRGMLKGHDGLHPARSQDGRLCPSYDLLVDDDGASLDLVHRTLEILEKVVGEEHIEACTQELEQMLGSDLRTWFRSSFFERHLKRYSKSRRKAPIYWQLGTPSASYSVWLYYPRLTRDTLYRVLNEVVKPKVTYEEQRLTEMRGEGATRRQIEIQEGFVEELRTFREEVTRVAPLWNPDLDDGVLLNFAPLWRLTPHSGWRRDTKAAWDALVKGDYDWAKLAMKLWPERVIPKCARERHLALAHDLEATLQATPVEELIRVGTSPAVKDALQSLLSAPALGGSARAPRAATPRRATPTEDPAPAPTPRSRGAISDETLAAIKEALVRYPQGAAKADVLETTNLADAAWNTAIQVLLDRGEVERRGEKRGTRYLLQNT